jgi:hypothetical protein
LEATLAGWRQQPLRVLHNDNPDVAVARGGVAYALGQSGQAPVIGGGSARSYFLLLDAAGPADKPRRAVCILPRGAAENKELLLADRTFACASVARYASTSPPPPPKRRRRATWSSCSRTTTSNCRRSPPSCATAAPRRAQGNPGATGRHAE